MDKWTVFFNEVDIKDLGFRLLHDHDNPMISGTRDRTISIPGKHGAYDFGADLEPISFMLPFYFSADDVQNAQNRVRLMKSMLLDGSGHPKTFKLTFGYEPDRFYNVRFTGHMSIDRMIGRSGRFELPLICYEGLAWSTAESSEVVWGSETITFENEAYHYGHSGDGEKEFTTPGTTVVNVSGGNVQPILNIDGKGKNVNIKCNGKNIKLGTFSNANWIVDLDEYTILKNGENAIHLIDGNWIGMSLIEGKNTLEVNGNNLDLNLRISFKDRFF